MSAAAFQGALARIITTRSARTEAENGTPSDGSILNRLTAQEAAEITRLATDPGLLLTAKLVASFRLGKVLALLPLTRELLGNATLADELDIFWHAQPPVSFYMPDEVLAFCDHLERRIRSRELTIPHLHGVVSLERAEISKHRPQPK